MTIVIIVFTNNYLVLLLYAIKRDLSILRCKNSVKIWRIFGVTLNAKREKLSFRIFFLSFGEMSMARNSFARNKNGFTYRGDLEECIKLAQRRIDNLHLDDDYITRMYKDAKRRYEAHFKAISTATDFIECAKAHLEKQKQEAAQTEAKP